jgi:4-oxalocrotonate tautomerase
MSRLRSLLPIRGKPYYPCSYYPHSQGTSRGKKRALARAITEVVAEHLDVKPEAVIFIIDEYDSDDWAVGGVLHSDELSPSKSERNI